jgi:hypothetical protein
MARVRLFDAGRRHTRTAQAELDLEGLLTVSPFFKLMK